METLQSVAKVIFPILLAIGLGVLARRKQLMTKAEVKGLQQFAVQFGLPCVVFNSCLTADMGLESLSSMALVLIPSLLGAVWAFRRGTRRFGYRSLPLLFCAAETGMLGIPLFLILFGAQEAYRMGVLDLAQSVVAIPTIAILTASTGENPSVRAVAKKVFSSPLLICSLVGLGLNLSGIGSWLEDTGFRSVLTESTSFLAQPVSALMIFSVGYNFSLEKDCRRDIFRICLLRYGVFAVVCLAAQGILSLLPDVDLLTRIAIGLYCLLPGSYLSPSMGENQRGQAVISGVCSVMTVCCLIGFCILTAWIA